MKEISNIAPTETEIELFVLDPSSESLVPDRTFKSKAVRNMILKIPKSDLPYPLESVDEVKPPPEEPGSKVSDGPPIPGIAGAVAGCVVLIIAASALVIFYRRKNKKYVFLSKVFVQQFLN